MKKLKTNLILSVLAVLFLATAAMPAMAYDHDNRGWYDEHHHHHPFVRHGGHRGYWDHDNNGARIFISI